MSKVSPRIIALSQGANSIQRLANHTSFTPEAQRWQKIADIMRQSAIDMAMLENKLRLIRVGIAAVFILLVGAIAAALNLRALRNEALDDAEHWRGRYDAALVIIEELADGADAETVRRIVSTMNDPTWVWARAANLVGDEVDKPTD